MKYLVIDTETTGLPDNKKPADAEGQPRIAHFGMIFLDESLAVEREESFIIKPDGWVMPKHVEAINGLSTAYLTAHGRPIAMALDAYAMAVDAGYVVVAHNAQFDCKLVRGELRRAGRDDMFDRTPNICTMRALTGVCKIPNARGNGFKSPRLAEAVAHFKLPSRTGAAHSAMDDARDTMLLLRKMIEIGVCPEPAVHRAKEGTDAADALKARGGTPEPSRLGLNETAIRPADALPPLPVESRAPGKPSAISPNIADEEIPH